MPGSLELKKTSGGEILPNYGGKTFPDERSEISFLQRLQSLTKLDGIEWGPDYFGRLQFLENKKMTGLSPEQRERYNYLTRLRNKNEDPWPEELRTEFSRLQDLVDRKSQSRVGY